MGKVKCFLTNNLDTNVRRTQKDRFTVMQDWLFITFGTVSLWNELACCFNVLFYLSFHLLELVVNGVFDRFPNFKIIVRHMGEHDFHRWRADNRLDAMQDQLVVQ
jgi:predicted TIM-barrel fold metal-dependent hydrolase